VSFDASTASREELFKAYIASFCLIDSLNNQVETFQKKIEDQTQNHQKVIQQKDKVIKEQEARIKWFERQVFGARSERLIAGESRQVPLFKVPETPPAETVTVKSFERTARKSPTVVDGSEKARFSETVPVDEVVVLPEEVKDLPEDAYEVIGEKVTERLAYTPVQYRVKRTIRKTVKLKERILAAPAPESVIDKSFADVSFLAGLITDKFQYHLPLYRQHQRMLRAGVTVSREHLTKLTHRSLELLEPVYNAILSQIVSSETVGMDETPVKAGIKQKGMMKTGCFWAVANEEEVAFVFSETKRKELVAGILGDLCKKLITDGNPSYGSYSKSRENFIHAQCWAHVRRKFFEAKEHSPPEAEYVLVQIAELFAIEQKARDLEERSQLRRIESTHIVNELFCYLESLWLERMTEPESLLGKAISYARDAEKELRVFLSHPDIPLSNNSVERAIRPIALGRKNWLFCWSELGAKYAAMAFTIVESCRMQGVDPFAYISDVLVRISSHPATQVHLLAPKNWKIHYSKL
jgi:transposase